MWEYFHNKSKSDGESNQQKEKGWNWTDCTVTSHETQKLYKTSLKHLKAL